MTRHRIAAIAGDGIGTEVLPEGLRVVETAAATFGIDIEIESGLIRAMEVCPLPPPDPGA